MSNSITTSKVIMQENGVIHDGKSNFIGRIKNEDQQKLIELLEEQRRTISALNDCIGGENSATTENITHICRLENKIKTLVDDIYKDLDKLSQKYMEIHTESDQVLLLGAISDIKQLINFHRFL